jgi:hypothetical protein
MLSAILNVVILKKIKSYYTAAVAETKAEVHMQ